MGEVEEGFSFLKYEEPVRINCCEVFREEGPPPDTQLYYTYPVVSDTTLLPVSNGIVEEARLDSSVLPLTVNVSGDSRSSRLLESPIELDDVTVVVSVDDRLQLR